MSDFGAFSEREDGGAPAFSLLNLPESSVSWVWLWDMAKSDVTLGAGPVVSYVETMTGGSPNRDAEPYTVAPDFDPSWRNGQGAWTPAATKAMQQASEDAIGAGPSAYMALYVGEIPVLDGGGEDFRIPLSGMGAGTTPNQDASPIYLRRVAGTWSLRAFAGSEVVIAADVGAWSGLPFIIVAEMDGADSVWTAYVHGIADLTVDTLDPGTRGLAGFSGSGLRWGGGGTWDSAVSGVWNAPLAVCGGASGTLSAADRAYILAGLSARFDIVPL